MMPHLETGRFTGERRRTVPEAIKALDDALLAGNTEETRAQIADIVLELKGHHSALSSNFGSAKQNEVATLNVMGSICRALSDSRLGELRTAYISFET